MRSKRSDKVCFTVVSGESVEIEDEAWAPFLKSAVVFGRCHLVADRGESDALCKKFAMKYYPTEKMVDDEVAASGKAVQMFRISIDHISGKKVQERYEKKETRKRLFFIAIKHYQFAEKI